MKLSEISICKYDTILLDRDGTINVHILGDYVRKWEDFEFIPGVLETIARWSKKVKYIIIVTNQRGIGKGIYTEKDLNDIHTHMLNEIENVGGHIDAIYYSTAVSASDERRKPGRKMYDEILRDFSDIDPSKTLMIGDGDVDELFAKNCGIAFIRVDSLKQAGKNRYWVKSNNV